MTTIGENTFKGPNHGNAQGYIPDTVIESAKMDADLLEIKADLDKLLDGVQSAFAVIDQIDLNEIGPMTAEEIVTTINNSTQKIDIDNLANDVVTDSELEAGIEAHRVNTTFAKMHPENTIRSTELSYSTTPSTLLTTCTNLLDELKNIRYQISRLNGKTYWSDTPVASLSSLHIALNNDISNLTSHIANMDLHLTACQNAAIDAAHSPCGSNPFATINDIATHGNGDMLRSVYDKDRDGIVDVAEKLQCGCGHKSYDDIVSKIATDITTHRSNASAHHTRYTNAEAIGAINGDIDHSATAKHYYEDLLNKPPSNSFTNTEVTNLRASKLANGTTPWLNVITANSSGLLPANKLPIEIIDSTWTEDSSNTASDSYFSSTVAGGVIHTFTGPCLIYGGFGTATQNNSYFQYSVNGGSTWKNCSLSPLMLRGISSLEEDMYNWICPFIYVPLGYTYKIRCGSTYTGTEIKTYGAGYNIRYRQL